MSATKVTLSSLGLYFHVLFFSENSSVDSSKCESVKTSNAFKQTASTGLSEESG